MKTYKSFDRCPECGGDTVSADRIYLSTGDGLVRNAINSLPELAGVWSFVGLCLVSLVLIFMLMITGQLSMGLIAGLSFYGIPFLVIFLLHRRWTGRHPWVAEFVCQNCNHQWRVTPGEAFPEEKFDLARHLEERRRDDDGGE